MIALASLVIQNVHNIAFGDDARAMSEAQIEAYHKAHEHLVGNVKPSAAYICGLANYRRPVYVPEGWSYWYSIADEGII